MPNQRNRHPADFKARIALEAIKGLKTANQLASEYGVHPTQIAQWKKQLLAELPHVFSNQKVQREQSQEALTDQLYQQIGQLKVELDWLKKKLHALALSPEVKRSLADVEPARIAVARQCELLSLPRSSFYYQAHPACGEPACGERDLDRQLMQLLDQQYTLTPCYGSRKMTHWLRSQGHEVNRKRVARLMRQLGLEAIYPKPHTSGRAAEHRIYPYLLRGLKIERADQVWSSDITSIRLRGGFVYLVAVMDWFSRYVLSWQLSLTLEGGFCVEALRQALALGRPEIFNSDQGAQFTSATFTEPLLTAGVRISMDGRGRALDNIFIERLWRTVKYEEVYLKEYESPRVATASLEKYFHFYNGERLHQSLGYRTPAAVYREK